MSRTIFTCVVLAGLGFAAGCGSEPPSPPAGAAPDGTAPASPTPPAPPAPSPEPAPPPKAEPPKSAWELDQTKHAVPAAPVAGKVAGIEMTPAVQLEGADLIFRSEKAGTPVVRLNLAPMLVAGQAIPPVFGREWKVKIDAEQGPNVPHVWLDLPGANSYFSPTGYALTLALGQRKDGKVPGRVCLCLPDEQKTVLAGTFEAAYSRAYTDRPGADEVPYIGGEVAVTGAKPSDEVRVSYVAFTSAGVHFKDMKLVFAPPPTMLVLFERDESSTFVRGMLNGEPFRYEHVKLAPGRYLVSAGVTGGPAVWKWVDVAAGGALTENFAVDAARTGGVEVSTPPDVKGKVFAAPADDPTQPALDANVFNAVSMHVVRQDCDVLSGKALLKNLAPGKYEVRVGDLRGTVEVVAGKTAELTLAPPKKQ
jgi:hypothetical protein